MSYDLKSYRRGEAYIFVNKNYDGTPDFDDRAGADTEYKELKRMFKDLTFKLKPKMDVSNEIMIKELEKACSDPRMKEASCFVCVICTHGIEKVMEGVKPVDGVDKVIQHYLVDGKGMEIETDKIISLIRDCKALQGKPKLFFIQVCRDRLHAKRIEKFDLGVTVEMESQEKVGNKGTNNSSFGTDGSNRADADTKDLHSKQPVCGSGLDSDTDTDDGLSDTEEFDRTDYFRERQKKIEQRRQRFEEEEDRQRKEVKETDDKPFTDTDSKFKLPGQRQIDITSVRPQDRKRDQVTVTTIPCFRDMLVMFASNTGKYGLRHSNNGGVLISSLCHVINGYLIKHGHGYFEKKDFLTVLTEVVNHQTNYTGPMEVKAGITRDVTTVPVIYHKFTKDMYIPIMKPSSWIQQLKKFLKR